MHEDIQRFVRSGWTDNTARSREEMIDDLERQMRDEGYVPSIDNYPQYTVNYVEETEKFFFILSVYMVYVGKEESWEVSGVTNGKKIMKHIPLTKSSQSSNTAE